ncbi:MAG: FliA/WhiG family RNA polymerase sigma factor [Myxococcota bacterium]|nr:FliA/WhiG family RNA polymerase sigma factor [Myxococcota bacterium]
MLRAATRNAYVQSAERRIDGMTRNECCVHFQGKVQLLARRLMERLPDDSGVEMGDLISYGAIGLLEAFDRYDGSRNIQFSTYAEYRIRGAMLDALRAGDTFSRRRRQLARRVESATVDLRKRLGRPAEAQEIADELGIELEDYWIAMERVAPISHVSLDSQTGDEESRSLSEQLFDPDAELPDRPMDVDWLRGELQTAIGELPERERHCILMYYGKELSLAEIALVYEVTPSRISQILSKARGRLRKKLSQRLDDEDLGLLQ